ncbi:MAG: beta-lactamase family protein [Bryobacterales bacterium]|nr:beta-lactamase family protein [Bryobacterales bacterium]
MLSLFLTAGVLCGAWLDEVPAAQAGLHADALTRATRVMNASVEKGEISGYVGLIARRGKIGYFHANGRQGAGSNQPVTKDSIFRIFSMTKPVTGVAVMMLYEEGKLFLTDPVSKYLPEYANMQVKTGAAGTVSAEKPITIRDLMRHTAGFDYSGMNLAKPGMNLAAWSLALAKQPLLHQPGTRYHYAVGIDVLGRFVEAVSGQSLDQFFDERIFRPLGMKDTGFWLPAGKVSRLVSLDEPDGNGKAKPNKSAWQDMQKTKPEVLWGGAGLVSTAMDYARFAQMLLNKGELDGKRLLSRKSVELMASDHLGNLPVEQAMGAVAPGYGFGLTMAVNKGPGRTGTVGSEGEFNWSGAAGTGFWVDPKEELIGVFMINQLSAAVSLPYRHRFKQLAYLALD